MRRRLPARSPVARPVLTCARAPLSLSLPSRSIETLANLTTLAEDPYGYIINTQYGQDLEPWQRAAVDALKPHVKDI